jgi:anti-anti-sigma regulatory factor
VKIVAVSDRVLKVFQLTGLERVFVICASVCEAVRGETG